MKRKFVKSSLIILTVVGLLAPISNADEIKIDIENNIAVESKIEDETKVQQNGKKLETVNNYFIGVFRLYDENTGKIYDFQANKAFTYDYKKNVPPLIINEYSYEYLIKEMNNYFFESTSKTILYPEKSKDGKYLIKSIKANTKSIDKNTLKKELSNRIKTNDYSMVKIPVTNDTKKLIEAEKKEVILLSSYTTKYDTYDVGRSSNVEMSAKQIGGTKLVPGERFSYNTRTKPIYPYLKTAKVIVADEFVDGVGGGICQTSSTLFNTVLEAGLQIDTRFNHSKKVFYLPAGRDAMVSYYHDFIFTNSFKNDIYIIYEKTNPGELTIKIYGKKSDKKNVKTWVNTGNIYTLCRQMDNNIIKFHSNYR